MGHKKTIEKFSRFLSENANLIESQSIIPDSLFKAGALPFVRGISFTEYLFMKPVSKHGDDPGIQIAKGSRLYMLDGRWRDSKDNTDLATSPSAKPEPILINALREAAEELGLEAGNIKRIMSGFITTYRVKGVGEERKMFLLPVEVNSKDNFPKNLPDGIAELIWLRSADFSKLRPDFAVIATELDKIIR